MPNARGVSVEHLAAVVDGRVAGSTADRVTDVVHDSRDVAPGALFVAIRGLVADGHDFVRSACDNGATALCVEDVTTVPEGVASIIVGDTRAALGPLAAAVHDYPSERLHVTGITGTNGKTTVAYLLRAILEQSGELVGLIGTNGAFIGNRALPNVRTTPEASDLQRILATMASEGAQHVVMEVSSHALALHRVDGTNFTVGAFTNLSQDHLDFHEDMDDYFQAKSKLFDYVQAGVVSTSSAWGTQLVGMVGGAKRMVTVGPGGSIHARHIELRADGSSFTLVGAEADVTVSLSLPGRFNIENALVAIGCALELGIDVTQIVEGLAALPGVPGRFERVGAGVPAVFVDYAHTPEGVDEAIAAAREFTDQRVLVVLGAGGDRDATKRPKMGAAASAADEVWITSDNPRSENPMSIIEAVAFGATSDVVHVEVDRRQAIRAAVGEASAGDTVLILGKGHEQGQDIDGVVLPFDDRVEVAEALKEMSR